MHVLPPASLLQAGWWPPAGGQTSGPHGELGICREMCLFLPHRFKLAGGRLQGAAARCSTPALRRLQLQSLFSHMQVAAGGSAGCLPYFAHAEPCPTAMAASSRSLRALLHSEGASGRLVAPRRVQQQELEPPAYRPAPYLESGASLGLLCIAASRALSALCPLPWPAAPAPGSAFPHCCSISVGPPTNSATPQLHLILTFNAFHSPCTRAGSFPHGPLKETGSLPCGALLLHLLLALCAFRPGPQPLHFHLHLA